MKVKTATLTGPALDWATAVANGWVTYPTDSVEQGAWFHTNPATAPRGYEHNRIHRDSWTPSTNWAQGGPIIGRECMEFDYDEGPQNYLAANGEHAATGKTHLVAAMRCFVASKLGEHVEVPDALN